MKSHNFDPYWNYIRNEEKELCKAFFLELTKALEGDYDLLASKVRRGECSMYLCPKGTTDQVTYYSKPELSFRFSDHWNWYTSLKKNPDPKYIQCWTTHLPAPKKRQGDGLPSDAIMAHCVCLFILGKYRVVYGAKYDQKRHSWSWVNSTVDEVVARLKGRAAA